MDRHEFRLTTGGRVMLDKEGISFYGPHESGSGTRMIVGAIGQGLDLHLADEYAAVRSELTLPTVDRVLRNMEGSAFDDRVRNAREYAGLLRMVRNVEVYIVNEGVGIRVEVHYRPTSQYGENSLTWSELREAGGNSIVSAIDKIVSDIGPPIIDWERPDGVTPSSHAGGPRSSAGRAAEPE